MHLFLGGCTHRSGATQQKKGTTNANNIPYRVCALLLLCFQLVFAAFFVVVKGEAESTRARHQSCSDRSGWVRGGFVTMPQGAETLTHLTHTAPPPEGSGGGSTRPRGLRRRPKLIGGAGVRRGRSVDASEGDTCQIVYLEGERKSGGGRERERERERKHRRRDCWKVSPPCLIWCVREGAARHPHGRSGSSSGTQGSRKLFNPRLY